VIAGEGPCNRERLEARRKAWNDGAWFRDGLTAHAEKQAARRQASRIAAE
jgi:ring-1,2-phenylacetyl-CoA epoxidase subunit PaaA